MKNKASSGWATGDRRGETHDTKDGVCDLVDHWVGDDEEHEGGNDGVGPLFFVGWNSHYILSTKYLGDVYTLCIQYG